MPRYKYALVIRGEVEARNRSSAYQLVLMGANLDLRLITTKHEVGLDIRELETEPPDDPAEQAADERPIPATSPFVRPPDG